MLYSLYSTYGCRNLATGAVVARGHSHFCERLCRTGAETRPGPGARELRAARLTGRLPRAYTSYKRTTHVCTDYCTRLYTPGPNRTDRVLLLAELPKHVRFAQLLSHIGNRNSYEEFLGMRNAHGFPMVSTPLRGCPWCRLTA